MVEQSPPRKAAIRAISSRVTKTYPGAPVQQFPHWVQVNRSPSAYQAVEVSAFIRVAPHQRRLKRRFVAECNRIIGIFANDEPRLLFFLLEDLFVLLDDLTVVLTW